MPTANGPLRNLVVIENNTIDSLAANVAFQQAFPHLAALIRPKPVKVGCRRCMKKQRATLAEYRAFKNSLAAMQPQDKIRFKQFLDCKNVRVVHVNAANKVIERTF
jgi:hypothetical protein